MFWGQSLKELLAAAGLSPALFRSLGEMSPQMQNQKEDRRQ